MADSITQSLRERTTDHLSKASWRNIIWMVLVEPFATREELLEAERVAIRTEFPKYNRVLNRHRHPVQELSRKARKKRQRPPTKREANRQRFKRVLARRAAEAAPLETRVQR
jgi:hypothetical protein